MTQKEQLEAFMEKVKANLIYYRSHKVDEVAKYDLDARLAHIEREVTALIQEARADERQAIRNVIDIREHAQREKAIVFEQDEQPPTNSGGSNNE